MSDTTHEAPERIWAGNWLADLGQGSWDIGEWRDCDWPSEGYKTVEYVRADLIKERSDEVQAAVAAALREADKAVQSVASNCTTEDGHVAIIAAVEKVRSLITEEAQAALDRVVAAERDRIVSIYRKLSTGSAVGAGDGDTLAVQYVDPEQFAAAIRKGGE